jgi:hypothetical protein
VAQRFSAAISGPFSTAALAAECTSGERFDFFSSLRAPAAGQNILLRYRIAGFASGIFIFYAHPAARLHLTAFPLKTPVCRLKPVLSCHFSSQD